MFSDTVLRPLLQKGTLDASYGIVPQQHLTFDPDAALARDPMPDVKDTNAWSKTLTDPQVAQLLLHVYTHVELEHALQDTVREGFDIRTSNVIGVLQIFANYHYEMPREKSPVDAVTMEMRALLRAPDRWSRIELDTFRALWLEHLFRAHLRVEAIPARREEEERKTAHHQRLEAIVRRLDRYLRSEELFKGEDLCHKDANLAYHAQQQINAEDTKAAAISMRALEQAFRVSTHGNRPFIWARMRLGTLPRYIENTETFYHLTVPLEIKAITPNVDLPFTATLRHPISFTYYWKRQILTETVPAGTSFRFAQEAIGYNVITCRGISPSLPGDATCFWDILMDQWFDPKQLTASAIVGIGSTALRANPNYARSAIPLIDTILGMADFPARPAGFKSTSVFFERGQQAMAAASGVIRRKRKFESKDMPPPPPRPPKHLPAAPFGSIEQRVSFLKTRLREGDDVTLLTAPTAAGGIAEQYSGRVVTVDESTCSVVLLPYRTRPDRNSLTIPLANILSLRINRA